MRCVSTDTTPAAEQRQHEIFKQMSGDRRLLLAMAFSDCVRDIALKGMRRRHPAASEGELKVIYFKEMYGASLSDMPERKIP